ncbi:hypothetical protein JOE44_000372 [Chryseobacterium sp. PvR013]|uniref:hypothetical protein n=1 Tax=Chryseobacterium sp. PvR013 TaxID=2806595 RepID=UPI001AE38EE9|nr:hypothetical protein [Chryseobacterium sp. PvR013]MBP1163488.1 hypothetical protein [Chryseobacterium sp. PvR013]
MQNKYNFIRDMLLNKKLTFQQKERILILAEKEFKKEVGVLKDIDFRLKIIEDIIQKGKTVTNIISNKKENSNITSYAEKEEIREETIYYIDLKNIPRFLRLLNNNNYTKFLTHDIDSSDLSDLENSLQANYSFEKHLTKIKEVFDVLTVKDSKYKTKYSGISKITISKDLHAKIKSYINGGNKWGEHGNSMNWSDRKLLKWCQENPNKVPTPAVDLGYEGYRFKDLIFKDIVYIFKNEIHIRESNSLVGIIKAILFEPINKFYEKIETNFDNVNDTIELFTDVEKVKQIIRKILFLIIDKHSLQNIPNVEFTFTVNDGYAEFFIFNKSSKMNSDNYTFRFGKHTKSLMKLCNGLCDLEIFTDLKDGSSYKIPIWTKGIVIQNDIILRENKEITGFEVFEKLPNPVDGILYKLKFDLGLKL